MYDVIGGQFVEVEVFARETQGLIADAAFANDDDSQVEGPGAGEIRRDEERFLLSDATCSALQLANFWQDVTVDLQKDRVYLPLHLFRKHGYSVEELFARRYTPAFRKVMIDAVDYAEDLFHQGLPLIGKLDRRLSLDIDLFSRGGMQVLRKIRSQDYNVLASRPAISKSERAWLLLQSLFRLATRKAA